MNDNPLSKYIGRTFKVIDEVSVKNGVSKDGSPYVYIVLHFINGFEKRIYPNDAERFAIISAFESEHLIDTLDNKF